MPRYVLDTDSITFHQAEREALVRRVSAFPAEIVCTTVITEYEQLRGRVARIHRAQTSVAFISACEQLQKTVHYFARVTVLPFTSTAAQYFERFREQKIRIGTQDLRIAAIVLAFDGILVTSNRRDFRNVPGLLLEDWNTPL